jgi:Asp-tRNA(Asn)/Glu-tRNA(Gln) amidotransferase A subunit family amidase
MLLQQPTKTIAILEALRLGDLSIQEYIDQLEAQFNLRESDIQAFLPEENRFERLRHEANSLEKKYPNPKERALLFGLPVGVKDIFRVDGFETHAGSRLPPEELAGLEAESVATLKNAGALVMGKTVTTEFAYFAPGPTRNPHNLEHTPGGSSSGSAAAVAAGMLPLALGTQTIGSITRPASFCGVFGFKPSYDRISKAGVIPLAPSVDHVGVFATDLDIAEIAAGVLCKDWVAEKIPDRPGLGVPEGVYLANASEEMLAHFDGVKNKLALSGYQIHSIPAMPDFDPIVSRHNVIVAAEAAQTHKVWFEQHEQLYHQKTADLIRRGQKISIDILENARKGRENLRSELMSLMREYGVDVWISPSAPDAAPKGLESTGNPVMNLPWTHSGLPTMNIPSGANDEGLPLGLQVAAGWYEDEKLFHWCKDMAKVLSQP